MSANPPLPPAAAPPALAPAQHKAALWADAALQVDAVISGERVPGLPARLAGADVADFDCLLPGALPAELQRRAPYLVRLRRDAAFTDWLLFEAAAGLPDWGLLVSSATRFMGLRSHLRSLGEAQTPQGQTIPLAWMDPTLLRALLPLFSPAQLEAFFGPVQALVIPGPAAWTTATLQLGRLSWQSAALAASQPGPG
ncbi:MAG TPA: DUF4123 domain-containing protein [Ideonella sp.]|nr:DUF4123 domain-containing protein [Ideonella sp.]